MKFNLPNLKKVAEDKHTTTFEHKDGHKIIVAHKQLGPKMRASLAALKLANGGEVGSSMNAIKKENYKSDGGEISDNEDPNKKKTIGQIIHYPGMADGGEVDPREDVRKKQLQVLEGFQRKLGEKNPPAANPPQPSTQEPEKKESQVVEGFEAGGTVGEDGIPIATDPNQINMPSPQELAIAQQADQAKAKAPETPKTDIAHMTTQSAPFGVSPETAAQMAQSQPSPNALPDRSPQSMSTNGDQQPQSGPAPDPYGTEAYQQAYTQGITEQKAGILGEAAAQGQAGEASTNVLSNASVAQKNIEDHYNNTIASMEKERRAAIRDIQNQHIDPNHYMSSKTDFQKVSTAIGLILGGIGGGLTGRENPALQFLQANMNRDIEAQKTELGKRENLLSANLRQWGNMRDATEMTRLMQMDLISTQLKTVAAQTQDPAAKSRALQAAGQIDQQAAPIMSQMAVRRTLLGGANGQGQPGVNIPPENKIRALITDPHEKEQAMKELKEAKDATALRDSVLDSYDRITKLNTIANRVGSPIQSPKQIAQVMGPALDKLTKDTSGRVTPQTVHLIEGLFHTIGGNAETDALGRRKIHEMLSQGMHYPTLNSWGIDTGQLGRFNDQGQSNIRERAR